ncbi:LuxR family transcriptional regulator [Actinoplanes missouriensis]|uniref:LuxR family transcriptional regulator n=1 Tax=Actinoplanes missouriensis TaxID=1866 RepID=UPI0033EB3222
MPELWGRHREQDILGALLGDVRQGRGRALILRGPAGIGKTRLLEYARSNAPAYRVIRVTGFAAETEIAYSGLQHLCAPLLAYREKLSPVHRTALGVALGLASGPEPELLVLGLATRALLEAAAADSPLLCLIDDAQWLDRTSGTIVAFVARRVESAPVAAGVVVGTRASAEPAGLPELIVGGLAEADARDLLGAELIGPIGGRVRDRIVTEAGGNPRALLESARGWSPAELAFGLGAHHGGRSGVPESRDEAGFRGRIAVLPAETRTVLLAAAVEPTGDAGTLWRALHRLGAGPEATLPAVTDALIELVAPGTPACAGEEAVRRRPAIAFRHPAARIAGWRSAPAAALREVHAAFAAVAEDADQRAWHLAHAAGGPDEDAAAALEATAASAASRGGRSAAAAFLERAAELSPDQEKRTVRALAAARCWLEAGVPGAVPDLLAAAALGPLDARQRAELARLHGHVTLQLTPDATAVEQLLAAARTLATADPAQARATLLAAIHAAGTLPGGVGLVRRCAEAARALPPGDEPADLLLAGLATRVLDGYRPSVPQLLRALSTLQAVPAAPAGGEFRAGPSWFDLAPIAAPVAAELWDDASWFALTEQATRHARETGARHLLTRLADLRTDTSPGARLSASIEAAARAGDHHTAVRERDRLTELTSAVDTPWARAAQAVADALTGPPAETEKAFHTAIDAYGRTRLPLEHARARLLYGEWLRRASRRAAARVELRAAQEAFTALRAHELTARASRELLATGETIRRRQAGEWERLTAQETQIAHLAVAGRTNAEIGASLFLSRRTVEWHLRKVFHKLGIASRRQLATVLTPAG